MVASRVDSLPEVSTLFQGRDLGSGAVAYLQLTAHGLKRGSSSDLLSGEFIPFASIRDWFIDRTSITFLIEDPAAERLCNIDVSLDDDQASEFAYQFNTYRFAAYKARCPSVQASICGHCGCYVDAGENARHDVLYCPECHCMTDQAGRNLSVLQGNLFQFCGDGWFSIVGGERDLGAKHFSLGVPSLREQVVPVLTRMSGLLLWLSVALGILWMLPEGWRSWPVVLTLMGVALLSILLLGTHWSDLMMHGRLKPLIRQPEGERILALLRRGRLAVADELLEQSSLRDHPGMLFNAARARFQAGDSEGGWKHLDTALARCGNHPVLLRLAVEYAPADGLLYWEGLLEQTIAAGRLDSTRPA